MKLTIAGILLWLSTLAATAQSAVSCGTTISSPGSYYLSSNCSGAGPKLLEISSGGVSLNLNGKSITCTPKNPATDVVIGIQAAGAGILIFGGTIQGCYAGIHAGGASISVENVTFANSYIDIIGGGAGSVFKYNTFLVGGGFTSGGYRIGINCLGDNSTARNNEFFDLHRQSGAPPETVGEGVAVLVCAGETGVTVDRNWIENTTEQDRDIGVWVASNASAIVTRNTIIGFPQAIRTPGTVNATSNNLILREVKGGSYGVGGGYGTAAGNRIIGFDVAVENGVTDGGNTVYP